LSTSPKRNSQEHNCHTRQEDHCDASEEEDSDVVIVAERSATPAAKAMPRSASTNSNEEIMSRPWRQLALAKRLAGSAAPPAKKTRIGPPSSSPLPSQDLAPTLHVVVQLKPKAASGSRGSEQPRCQEAEDEVVPDGSSGTAAEASTSSTHRPTELARSERPTEGEVDQEDIAIAEPVDISGVDASPDSHVTCSTVSTGPDKDRVPIKRLCVLLLFCLCVLDTRNSICFERGKTT
jgi:hypothetical protein